MPMEGHLNVTCKFDLDWSVQRYDSLFCIGEDLRPVFTSRRVDHPCWFGAREPSPGGRTRIDANEASAACQHITTTSFCSAQEL